MEVMGRRGRRPEQLFNDVTAWRKCCKLREEALDRTVWCTEFGSGCGPVVRQTEE